MYLAFKYKDIMPSKFKEIKRGEKVILAAFLEKMMEEENEINNTISEAFGGAGR